MIPPVDPLILESNPAFADLHKHLSMILLASDCQTAATATSTARVEAAETLKKGHLQLARRSLLIGALKALASDGGNSLSGEARERCFVTAAVMQRGVLSEEEARLLKPDLERFRADLENPDSKIALLLSGELEHQHQVLRHIATPGSDKASARTKQQSPSLSANITRRMADLQRHRQATLPVQQSKLTNTAASLTSLYRDLLSLQIQHLERHTHGIETRSTKSQAEYLSTVSAGMASKAKILLLQTTQEIYSDEVQDALAAYAAHLEVIEERIGEKEEQLGEEFRLYQEQGEARMRECGRRYASVTKEVEDVKQEIERLRKSKYK